MPNVTDLMAGRTPDLRMDMDLDTVTKREQRQHRTTGPWGALARVTARLLSLIL